MDMNDRPGLDTESFKLKLTKSSFGNLGQNFKVLSEPKIVTENVFLLSTDDFSRTYSTEKGAKIAKTRLKLDKATIEPFQSQCYEYELEKL